MKTEQPPVIRLSDYTAPAFAIPRTALTVDLDPTRTIVEAVLEVERVDGGAPSLTLDAEGMELLALEIDGTSVPEDAYRMEDDKLSIAEVPERFTLTARVAIDPQSNTRLEGLYRSNGVFCTQCEAEGFRRIAPFIDRPDLLSRYSVTIRADKKTCPVLLSNGNLVESGDLDDGRHYAVWEDPFPKPAYLFALVAGDLAWIADRFTTRSGRAVDLRIHVEHGNEGRAGYAMESLKRSMAWDEERFGLEYDLDIFNIVAVSDFNMGAMENKSLNVFNAKYILADPESATDGDFAAIESIVGHEYFHNWTGNRITCRDWFQLSLKEGLTVFRDQEFSADMRSRPVKRIQDVRMLRARQFPEDAGPLAHPVRPDSYMEINNFYTATVYEKGAEVIRMLHALLGEEGFQKGMRLYVERHDGQAVTCDDFVAAMADANGRDLDHFKRWYAQAGTPEVTVESHHDPEAETLTLTLAQMTPPTPGQPKKQPVTIPLALALIGPDGREMPIRIEGEDRGTETVLLLTEDRQSVTFEGVAERPRLSLNRGFSAPIRLNQRIGREDRAFLMAHDTDPFARWEAGQQYACDLLLEMIESLGRGETPKADPAFIEAIGHTLANNGLDDAFRAQVLALPTEEYIGEQMKIVDVDAIHTARETLKRALADAHYDRLLATYQARRSNEAFAPDAEQAGRRALKNACLALLAASGTADTAELVRLQAETANNMTDRMAAIMLLTGNGLPGRDEALAAFRERWKEDEQVMDKWFAVQATSPEADTLDRVRKLMQDPVFSMRKPNKVRALIGAFAAANPVQFNRADGAGYDFLAEQTIALDRLNPQVAARLIGPLGHWRRFDETRRDMMKAALERILATKDLSRDCYEIASKALAD
ncbi:aminopeptidase N [Marivibrio halodurans]|uniref:Aminopeptidase N n=1 Tax=Marivibrio halodurans TaxID=2039722 RepID=A0A8J7SJP7_9PROT|nr:aminopeptidase N [Marivibrio halodurans]MBP5857903.1 aminopeptidase N [Marivibrio halodurans]